MVNIPIIYQAFHRHPSWRSPQGISESSIVLLALFRPNQLHPSQKIFSWTPWSIPIQKITVVSPRSLGLPTVQDRNPSLGFPQRNSLRSAVGCVQHMGFLLSWLVNQPPSTTYPPPRNKGQIWFSKGNQWLRGVRWLVIEHQCICSPVNSQIAG